MPAPIARLSEQERQGLFEKLNYLNIREYQGFCDRHGIPYSIYVTTASGGLKKTGERDRKKVVLERVRRFLTTGKVARPTVFSGDVVSSEEIKNFSASTRLHFGQYDKKNGKFIAAMQGLTGEAFRDGMIARVVIREFWTAGVAPTLKEYADAWVASEEGNLKRHPEAAYLTDLAEGKAGPEWKAMRIRNARAALAVLDRIR